MRFQFRPPWRHGKFRATGAQQPAPVTHGELLNDMLDGSAAPSLYSQSTVAWMEQQRELALAEVTDHEALAHSELEMAARSRRLAADLGYWLIRHGGRADEQPPRQAADAPAGRGDDTRFMHWSGGNALWPLCGEQFAVRQTRDANEVTCPACLEALSEPDPADGRPPTGSPHTEQPYGGLTGDDSWDYGQALGLAGGERDQAEVVAEAQAAEEAEASVVDGQPLYGGSPWRPAHARPLEDTAVDQEFPAYDGAAPAALADLMGGAR